eukprot:9498436-Pyramimonas_sp.AAC.1
MENGQSGEPILDPLLNIQRNSEYWPTFWQVDRQPAQQQPWWPNARAAASTHSYAPGPITSHE